MAAITRTSTRSVRSAPSGSNSRSCSTRSSLPCSGPGSVPISSRKMLPPLARAKRPFLFDVAPGERAAHVAEQLRFQQCLRDGGAVHLDERHVPLGAAVVNRPRHQLLAGPRLARDEHGALGLGHALGPVDDLLHRPAAADDAVVAELLVTLAEQVAMLGAKPLVLDGPADGDEQVIDLERLLQEVERSELHRRDGIRDGRVRRHHDDLRPLGLGHRS